MQSNQSEKTILFLITSLSSGGAQVMLYRLLANLNRSRYQPVVVSLIDQDLFAEQFAALKVPVYRLQMQPGAPSPLAIWQLRQIIKRLQPDLIQGWMYHANVAGWIASCLLWRSIPVCWSIHHSIAGLESEKPMTQVIIRLGVAISRFIQRVVFVSQTSQSQHERLGYSRRNSSVIPNGFDTALFQPSTEARVAVRQELGLSEQTCLIGLICRYHPMKDHDNFLTAAAELRRRHPSVHFVLAGAGVDWHNLQLRQRIDALQLRDCVHLLGERTDTPRLTAALDIATSASAYGEAFPLVLGEAMACGVPCVVTDVGDSRWIVGETGRTVPPADPVQLANAWSEILTLTPEERIALSRAARARIIEAFSLDRIVKQYEQLYDSVLATV